MENKIKEFLKEKGISQKELAEGTGLSEVWISKAVNGSASHETLQKVAAYLKVDISELTKSENDSLMVKFRGELNLNGIIIPCYVLADGRRVISGRGMQEALKMVDDNKESSGKRWARYLDQATLKPFIYKDKEEGHYEPIICYDGASKITGFEAITLADICDAFLEARKCIKLSSRQSIIADQCEILMRAFAKVGIIALIDEATGYDKEKTRAKDELQKFLSTFLNKEAAKWVKTFNDDFFEDIYRMRGWSWTGASKKPAVIGKWIDDIVYQRIGPAVLSSLKEKNPKDENGHRKFKHHQFLSDEVGKKTLLDYLNNLHTLAIISDYNWARFMEFVDKRYPKQYQQITLDFEDY